MIYILEDDDSIRELLCYSLEKTGFEAVGFASPPEFWAKMTDCLPDLLLLDIMLPVECGLSILKKLRGAPATVSLPVILLTAKSEEYDKVEGLEAGADDYIAKPFGIMELCARVRALLRRTVSFAETKVAELHSGELSVSRETHTVAVSGAPVFLTCKEFDLLSLLLEHEGEVLTRERIFKQVWGYAFDGKNRTLDVHIRTLRRKLGETGEQIETVRGIGYRILSRKEQRI